MTKYLCQIQRPFWLIKNIKNENKILEEDLNVKNPFKCQSCDFKSGYQRSLRDHISVIHEGEKLREKTASVAYLCSSGDIVKM